MSEPEYERKREVHLGDSTRGKEELLEGLAALDDEAREDVIAAAIAALPEWARSRVVGDAWGRVAGLAKSNMYYSKLKRRGELGEFVFFDELPDVETLDEKVRRIVVDCVGNVSADAGGIMKTESSAESVGDRSPEPVELDARTLELREATRKARAEARESIGRLGRVQI